MGNLKKRFIDSKTLQATISLIILFWVTGEQVGVWSSNVLQRLEWLSFDERVIRTLDGTHDPGIVIVDIDEKSLQEFGQWPWPRSYVARLVYELFESYQIQLLGLDVIFAEPEANLLATQWQQLRQHYPSLPESPSIASGDAILGDVLMSYPTVSAFYFDSSLQVASGAESQGILPPPLQVVDSADDWQQLPLIHPTRYSSNNEEVQPFVMAGGYFDNPLVDEDGVFRRVPLFQVWQEQLYPSLPLAMFSTLLGQPPADLAIYDGGGQKHLEGVDVGGFYFPTDPQGAVLVPWFGTREHFNYISASDVLLREVPEAQLAGKIVLLGTSAPGLMDLRSTPVGAVFPGVEIHASILAGMLQMNFKSEPGYSLAITLIALLITGLLMTWYYPRLSSVALLSISTLLTAIHVGVNLYSWQQGLVLPLASGLLLLLLMTGWHLSMNFWRESQQKRQVAEQFGRYIPPELVSDIVASPEAQDMLGQEKELTVLFSDVRGFTSFSENIPPAELTEVMNRLLTPVTKAIHSHQGTIDKYMGDAVMAFWGAPLKDQQHAIHALEGALAMQDALKDINDTFVQEGKKALAMGIGVHTGLMNVGNMGSEFRMAYTVLGDNVNLGSRLEGLTKGYGVDILFSESTLEHIKEHAPERFIYRKVDRVRVKGREAPLTIYQLIGYSTNHEAWLPQLASSNKALASYEQGEFKQAKRLFNEHLEQWPKDKLAKLYIGRCKEYIEEPPEDNWDGVFTHKTK